MNISIHDKSSMQIEKVSTLKFSAKKNQKYYVTSFLNLHFEILGKPF